MIVIDSDYLPELLCVSSKPACFQAGFSFVHRSSLLPLHIAKNTMNKLLVLLGAALVLAACSTKAPSPYGTPFPINPTTSAGTSK